ncbi:MAG: hypothetical protein BECKG1743E_GA0114224_112881 [Candidatus Kentron sp. G]|nr:MAG: hypothetical protein BECKG1743E_GA0114224_112881 [Candidatus Kentron sp. G]
MNYLTRICRKHELYAKVIASLTSLKTRSKCSSTSMVTPLFRSFLPRYGTQSGFCIYLTWANLPLSQQNPPKSDSLRLLVQLRLSSDTTSDR